MMLKRKGAVEDYTEKGFGLKLSGMLKIERQDLRQDW